MFCYIRILVLCALVGIVLSTVLMLAGGAAAGAVKGLLVGIFVAYGEWKWKHTKSQSIKSVGA